VVKPFVSLPPASFLFLNLILNSGGGTRTWNCVHASFLVEGRRSSHEYIIRSQYHHHLLLDSGFWTPTHLRVKQFPSTLRGSAISVYFQWKVRSQNSPAGENKLMKKWILSSTPLAIHMYVDMEWEVSEEHKLIFSQFTKLFSLLVARISDSGWESESRHTVGMGYTVPIQYTNANNVIAEYLVYNIRCIFFWGLLDELMRREGESESVD
jgi:hypothetical protein